MARERKNAPGKAGGNLAKRETEKDRRRKRSLKDAADLFLSLEVSDQQLLDKLAAAYVDPEDMDNQMAMVAGLVRAAEQGNASAVKLVVELLGEDAKGSGGGGGEVRIIDDL